jgi:hypothetical protein
MLSKSVKYNKLKGKRPFVAKAMKDEREAKRIFSLFNFYHLPVILCLIEKLL